MVPAHAFREVVTRKLERTLGAGGAHVGEQGGQVEVPQLVVLFCYPHQRRSSPPRIPVRAPLSGFRAATSLWQLHTRHRLLAFKGFRRAASGRQRQSRMSACTLLGQGWADEHFPQAVRLMHLLAETHRAKRRGGGGQHRRNSVAALPACTHLLILQAITAPLPA